jgi:nitroreductase
MDKYQERYLEHQKKKAITLNEIIKKRYSERQFSDKKISVGEIAELSEAIDLVPSSCNRRAIHNNIHSDRDTKAFLGGLLVGGVGWIHRASHIILLFADETAYKENLDYMKYLDAGVIVHQIYLKATEMGIGVCFVNPNIRDKQKKYFYDYFYAEDRYTFVGAIALGYKDD